MASSATIASEMGRTKAKAAVPAIARMIMISWVA